MLDAEHVQQNQQQEILAMAQNIVEHGQLPMSDQTDQFSNYDKSEEGHRVLQEAAGQR